MIEVMILNWSIHKLIYLILSFSLWFFSPKFIEILFHNNNTLYASISFFKIFSDINDKRQIFYDM